MEEEKVFDAVTEEVAAEVVEEAPRPTGMPEIPVQKNIFGDPIVVSMDEDSGLPVRTGVYIAPSNMSGAYYKQSYLCQPRCNTYDIYTEDGIVSVNPEFETTNIVQMLLQPNLDENAQINFHYGCNIVQLGIRDTQRIILENGETTFTSCDTLPILFADGATDITIVATNSNVDLTRITAAQAGSVNLKLFISGGTLKLPTSVSMWANWQITATNCRIYAPTTSTSLVAGLSASNCWIQANNALYVRKAENCRLCFNGTTASNITLQGGMYIGNIIESGTFDSSNITKTGVTFAADICIGNRPNMYHMSMNKTSACQVCLGNYDGDTVLGAAAVGDIPTVELAEGDVIDNAKAFAELPTA